MWRSDLASSIHKLGFRRWYERELIASHAHLVITFLCMVGLLGAFDGYDRGAPAIDQLGTWLSVSLLAAVGLWALRRYLFLLMHAESTANQAVCPQCGAYARFQIIAERAADGEVQVCCRHCSQRWTISG